jgi:hypothetical protein
LAKAIGEKASRLKMKNICIHMNTFMNFAEKTVFRSIEHLINGMTTGSISLSMPGYLRKKMEVG